MIERSKCGEYLVVGPDGSRYNCWHNQEQALVLEDHFAGHPKGLRCAECSAANAYPNVKGGPLPSLSIGQLIDRMVRDWPGQILNRDGVEEFVPSVVSEPPAAPDVVAEAVRRGVLGTTVSTLSGATRGVTYYFLASPGDLPQE